MTGFKTRVAQTCAPGLSTWTNANTSIGIRNRLSHGNFVLAGLIRRPSDVISSLAKRIDLCRVYLLPVHFPRRREISGNNSDTCKNILQKHDGATKIIDILCVFVSQFVSETKITQLEHIFRRPCYESFFSFSRIFLTVNKFQLNQKSFNFRVPSAVNSQVSQTGWIFFAIEKDGEICPGWKYCLINNCSELGDTGH